VHSKRKARWPNVTVRVFGEEFVRVRCASGGVKSFRNLRQAVTGAPQLTPSQDWHSWRGTPSWQMNCPHNFRRMRESYASENPVTGMWIPTPEQFRAGMGFATIRSLRLS
jgi:hypothetical protein